MEVVKITTLEDSHAHSDEHFLKTPINIKRENSISCGSDSESVPPQKQDEYLTDSEISTNIKVEEDNSDCDSIPPELQDYMIDFKEVIKYETGSEASSSILDYNRYKDTIKGQKPKEIQELESNYGNEKYMETKEMSVSDCKRYPKRLRKGINSIPLSINTDGLGQTDDTKSNGSSVHNSIESHSHLIPKKPVSRKDECRYCYKKIKASRERNEHENTHTGNRPYECRICFRTFASSANLFSHLQWHKNDRKHQCSLCETAFVRRARLDDHIREKHLPESDSRRYFPCPLCHAKLMSRAKLQVHRRTHRKYSESFFCYYCPKYFNTKPKINAHMAVHSGVKRYKCKFCNLKILHRPDVYKHQRICLKNISE